MTKILWVVAGALINDDGQVLLAQRPEGKNLAGFWEFPGGKIEPNETPRDALARELKEELDIDINPIDLDPLSFAAYDYPEFHIVMPLFTCRKWNGFPVSLENQQLAWVNLGQVGLNQDFPLPPADFDLAKVLRDLYQKTFD